MRKPFVGGNWKMNTNFETARELAGTVAASLGNDGLDRAVDVAIFPPFVYLLAVREVVESSGAAVRLGAQDAHFEPQGALTGEVSIPMLRDCGVRTVLTGHSERRHVLGESDGMVNAKTRAVLDSGLECILCIGETLAQRQAGQTDAVNERQVRAALAGVSGDHVTSGRLTIAYEPVWAIGTGNTATPADAQSAHAKIRDLLRVLYSPAAAEAVRIQYGGSCNAANAPQIMSQPDVDGALVGGASLKAGEFVQIVRAAAKARADA
ncbi:MAG: triose-phosphate isomerase [Phycisphaerales bacterium]